MGFAGYLEDIEERRSSNKEAASSWRHFAHFRTVEQRSSGRLPADVIRKFNDLAMYLSNSNDDRSLQDARQEFGDPFLWPRRLIDTFHSQYRSTRAAEMLRTHRWPRFVELATELHCQLQRLPIPPAIAEAGLFLEIRESLTELMSRHPEFGDLSATGVVSVIEEATKIHEAGVRLEEDLALFRERVESLLPDEIAKLDLDRVINQLHSIQSQLDSDLLEKQHFDTIVTELPELWKRFVRMHAHVLRPTRPPIEELSRLHLDEQQERIVATDRDGHWRISGPSGSGKSIVLLHRAARLARQGGRVTFLTLNRRLATAMHSAAEQLLAPSLTSAISFRSIDDLYLDLLHEQELLLDAQPIDSLITKKDGKAYFIEWCKFFGGHGFRPSRIFLESCADTEQPKRKKKKSKGKVAQRTLFNLIRSAGGIQSDINISRYLRDEVNYIRSGFFGDARDDYQGDPRSGRGLSGKRFTRPYRMRILQAAAIWDAMLSRQNLYDHERLSIETFNLLRDQQMREIARNSWGFDYLLVDEAQDLSTLDLANLASLVTNVAAPNSMLFAGDFEQVLHGRHHVPSRAGLSFQNRWTMLRRPYRNTRQIVEAALAVVNRYPPPNQDDAEREKGRPQSPWDGQRPIVLRSANREEQVQLAIEMAEARQDRRVAILCDNEFILRPIIKQLRATGISVVLVQDNEREAPSNAKQSVSQKHAVVVGRFIPIKGLEFDTVVILDFSENTVPSRELPKDEMWRTAAAVYVAMTRARDELIIVYEKRPSIYLKAMLHLVDHATIDASSGLQDLLSSPIQNTTTNPQLTCPPNPGPVGMR